MRVAVGADHAGFALKQQVLEWLKQSGHDVVDVGALAYDPVDDYPDSAVAVAEAVRDGRAERGIILCGSGIGAGMAANKIRGIRAGVCHDTYSAHQGVEHDDMNVLCLGGRIIGVEPAREIVNAFLSATFIDEEKYRRRLGKINALDERTKSKGS